MILSITDGIEVAEHTEPAERLGFLHVYRAAQEAPPVRAPAHENVIINIEQFMRAGMMARQAE